MEDIFKAHRFSSRHRKTLEQDSTCGCFHCLTIYNPKEITAWVDDETTALCPYCGIDAVIGENSGYPITKAFLTKMNQVWFSTIKEVDF